MLFYMCFVRYEMSILEEESHKPVEIEKQPFDGYYIFFDEQNNGIVIQAGEQQEISAINDSTHQCSAHLDHCTHSRLFIFICTLFPSLISMHGCLLSVNAAYNSFFITEFFLSLCA